MVSILVENSQKILNLERNLEEQEELAPNFATVKIQAPKKTTNKSLRSLYSMRTETQSLKEEADHLRMEELLNPNPPHNLKKRKRLNQKI
jgi:hypothetical protein